MLFLLQFINMNKKDDDCSILIKKNCFHSPTPLALNILKKK